MATLSGNKIKDTYQSLIKLTDNGNLTTGAKQLTDGFGNNSPLYISTTQIGIGVTPEATYDLHVYSNAKVGGNLTVTGDLTVEGTTTTIDTETLTVEDPLIEVASNNTSTDAVDIGWYGKYAPSGTTLYAGLFRDTGDSKFKLFRNLEEQPTTTVNTSGTGYTVATLVADVEGTLTGTIASSTVATTQSAGDNSTKVATTAYVDTEAGNYLPLAGGTMSGNIAMGSNNISGGGTFTATTFSGQLDGTISSTTTATTQTQGDNSTKVATTAYVDSAIGGQDTLAEILANGNTTGGTDIAVSAGDKITNFTSTGIDDNATSTALTIDSSQNATFASKVQFTSSADFIDVISGDLYIIAGSGKKNILYSNNVEAFRLDTSQNATLVGDLTVSGGNISLGGTGRIEGIDTVSANTDAANKLYVDNAVSANNELSEVLANGNTTGGTDIAISSGDDITFADGSSAYFGDSNDLRIAHTGGNSKIQDSGTGSLVLDTNGASILLTKSDTEHLAKFITDGAVELYYNNSKKFETTSSGITVTGQISADDLILLEGNTNPHLTIHDITNETYTTLWSGDTEGALTFSHSKLRIASTSNDFTGTDIASFEDSGQIQFNEYGSGTFTGTATYRLAVDSSGDVIEIPIGDGAVDGSGTANYVTKWSDTDTITNSIIYDNGTNVGIGETNPSANLHISGSGDRSIAITSGTSGASTLNLGDSADIDAGAIIYDNSNNSMQFKTNAAERMRITSGGDINCNGRIKVEGSNTDQYYFEGTRSGVGVTYRLYDNSNNVYHDSWTSQIFRLNQNGGSGGNLIITGGNVGISNTNPSYKLDVTGSIKASVQGRFANGSASAPSYSFDADSDIGMYRATTNTLGFSTAGSERMRIDSSGNVSIDRTSPNVGGAPSGTDGRFNVYTDEGSSAWAQQMRHDSTTGNGLFVRAGASSSYYTAYFAGYDESNVHFVVRGDGNVGIGETSPDFKLHVKDTQTSDTAKLQLRLEGNSGNYYDLGRNYQTGFFEIQGNQTGFNNIILGPDSGNVGIGTSPSTKLHISGGDSAIRITPTGGNDPRIDFTDSGGTVRFYTGYDVSSGNFVVTSDESGFGSSNIMVMSDAGNVGIGTTITSVGGSGTQTSTASPTRMLFNNNYSNGYTDASLKLYLFNSGTTRHGFTSGPNYDLQYHASGHSTNAQHSFYTNNNFVMRVGTGDTTNVGIGITSPDAKLHIVTSEQSITKFESSNSDGPYTEYYQGTTPLGFIGNAQGLANAGSANMCIRGQSQLIFAISSTERMRITSSGNVELKPTNPAGVSGTDTNYLGFRITQTNGQSALLGTINGEGQSSWGGDLIFSTKPNNGTPNDTVTERMRIDSSGNVGINVSPTNMLSIKGTSGSNKGLDVYHSNGNKIGELVHGGTGDEGRLSLYDSNVETVRFAGENNASSFINSGSLGINFTSPSSKLYVKGSSSVVAGRFWGEAGTVAPLELAQNSGGGFLAKFYSDTFSTVCGSISHSGSATAFNTSSDYRLKENVVEMTGALDRVEQLKPSRFNFIGHEEIVDGFLAHEVSDIVPEAITGEKDEVDVEGNPVYQGIDQSKLVPLLVGAIKELKARIEILENN